jgi:uncharacterized protein (DUF433 family)
MDSPLIHDRGRGPELKGSRITVYDLIPYLKDAAYWTDERLVAEAWPSVTVEGVAALRGYVADHYDEVMAVHREMDRRMYEAMTIQRMPEYDDPVWWGENRVQAFRDWRQARAAANGNHPADPGDLDQVARDFRELTALRQKAGR